MLKAIYRITNKKNQKVYIGQAKNPYKRFDDHYRIATSGRDEYPIHLAMKKYGKDSFVLEIIEWTQDYNEREKYWIQKENTLAPSGYNVALGGPNPVAFGEKNYKNIVKSEDIPNIIRDLKDNKMSDRAIAKKYNLTDKIISDINHGRTHVSESENYPLRVKKGRQILSEQQANNLKLLLKCSDINFSDLAIIFNTTENNISQINNGRNFKRAGEEYPLRKYTLYKNQFNNPTKFVTLKGIKEEDFANYKKISLFLAFPFCSFKCCKEAGCDICQNSSLAKMDNYQVDTENLIKNYLNNKMSEAIVFGGLEPFDSFSDMISIISLLRNKYQCQDDIVIYTGYNKEEILEQIDILKEYPNIIIKYGRFIPNDIPRYDDTLGITLISHNQFAEKIS